ncbi:hypothetical protein [Luethyella okanaganae]|uniref:SAF domain-containing protein n=1 Tax=Luethyella okanaganae TaxID=69372 RepID=A0ABW1VAS3_9MICO
MVARKDGARGSGARTFWFDPRFAIGIVLIAASVGGVYVVVASADDSARVYAARDALTVGQRIDTADLVVTNVRLGSARGEYLDAGVVPEGGLVVVRSVAAGELVPASAVGSSADADMTSVVVIASGRLSATVAAGARVDVWAADRLEQSRFGPPTVLVDSAEVVRVLEPEGLIADGGGEAVEITVRRGRVAAVLEAIANGDALSVVPATTPLGR